MRYARVYTVAMSVATSMVLLFALGILLTARFYSGGNSPAEKATPIDMTDGIGLAYLVGGSVWQDLPQNVTYQNEPAPTNNPLLGILQKTPLSFAVHVVQGGETLFSIAENYHIDPSFIIINNPQIGYNGVAVGETLVIPPRNGIFYISAPTDSLSSIGEKFSISTDQLRFWNQHYADGESTVLFVPVDEAQNLLVHTKPNIRAACKIEAKPIQGSGFFLWPTSERYISGFKYDPSTHPAIDIGGKIGNPVFASDHGVVIFADWDEAYGNLVIINHMNGYVSYYAHLNKSYVSCGQTVRQKDVIGELGSTGNSTGPHLHFEIRDENNQFRNPVQMITLFP